LEKAECIYETTAGWQQDLSDITSYDGLPRAVRDYIKLIEGIINVPISIVGVGPKRNQTIFRK
jgi:adenylosuccinate synthase